MRQDDKPVSRGTNKHTDRGTCWDDALLVPAGGRGGTLAPCETFLEQLLDSGLVDPGEREDVDTQVGALRGPRHFLECYVRIGILLQVGSERLHMCYAVLPSVSYDFIAALYTCHT